MTNEGLKLKSEILAARGGLTLWHFIEPTVETMTEAQANAWLRFIFNVKSDAKQEGRRLARQTGHFG
jgi:hypothetical protein